jgi:hypothetical protein
LSANVSYENTAQELEILTGLTVSHSTQQRLVQRYEFTEVRVNQEVEQLSVDGGKVRLRTPVGQGCEWRDYKAVNLHGLAVAVESTVKQMGRRVKISGAQWNKQNVSQVLFHRTAYLNAILSTTNYLQN